MRKWLVLFLVGAVVGFLIVPSARAQFFFMEPQLVGKAAPDFKLKNLQGQEQTLSGIRDGQRAIVFFWATWCPHCRRELSGLNSSVSALADQGIKVVTIDLGEKPAMVKRYMEKNKIQLPVLLDENQQYAEEYGVVGLPTFFFVDEDGVVRDVQHGLPEDLESSFSE